MSPFGLLGGAPLMGFGVGAHHNMFEDMNMGMGMGGNGFTSVQTFSGSMGGIGGMGGGMGMRSSSTSTRFVNGKKITTKK